MSNGVIESTVNERLVQTEKILDEYSVSLGTKSIKYNAEVEDVLELTQDRLKSYNEEDLGIKAYLLAQYSTFLQKEINRHAAKLKWATHNLDILVAKVYNNYGDKYMKIEVKRMLVINDNDVAKNLNKIILEASIRIEELNFLSSRISTQSSLLNEMRKSKRAERYER
jgi:hypothetical protein